ncbi:MAG TPA: NAD(P)/FAD-dependent oxidoreductase, partial [Opitutus sp.]|nr:NAD(P)/FAD-dependent oxidoreductase [Opitutus sp.]
IVGAGPAGLSAALVLGRCARNVLVFDSGKPRNIASRALHGYLKRDGTHPIELRALGRAELAAYPTVQLHDVEVVEIQRLSDRFEVRLSNDSRFQARFLLLATGRVDAVPEIPGFARYYGHGVYHCPFCDGWEHRGKALVVHGHGENAYHEALLLLTWSADVTICTDGPPRFNPRQQSRLDANGVKIVAEKIRELRGGDDDMLDAVVFDGRDPLPCDALFFCSDCQQKSLLPADLGCEFDEEGSVKCGASHQVERVPGLYVAGNVRGGVHLAIVAAAEGAEAAIAINRALLAQTLR